MIKISVIITTYNSDRYLQRLINSLYRQEGINEKFELEVIAVDDCSTDSTLDILARNQINYYQIETNSGGPNKGRNIGLKVCTGDYIIITDHDDEWLSNRVLEQLKYVVKAPIITCGYNVINFGRNPLPLKIKQKDVREYILYKKNETFLDKIAKVKGKQVTYLGSIMFHKDLRTIYFEEHFGQIDFDWIAYIFKGNESVEVCKTLYNRYVYDENLSMNKTYRIRDYYYSLMTLEEFQEDYPKAVKKGIKRINGSRARYHYLIMEMKQARCFFLKSTFNLKTLMFIISSFAGYKYVIKKYHFWG